MIVSFTRQFIFVHVIKAAGMSIEKALWPFDVRADFAGKSPQDQAQVLDDMGVSRALLKLTRHASAVDLRAALGAEVFGRMFKFAFVRNPWDFELSLYHFNMTHPEFPAHQRVKAFKNFEDFVLGYTGEAAPRGVQKRYIADEDGAVLVDFVGRFENLASDLEKIGTRIGTDLTIEHHNRTDHAPWQDCYTREMFERVRGRAQVDIESFGYSSDPAAYGLKS